MNPPELIQLAQIVELDNDDNFSLRIEFALACVERVEHLLTDQSVVDTLAIGKTYVAGKSNRAQLQEAAKTASKLARSHPGSGGIDGANNAAVSTSHGVAAALAGRALEAAAYAAYASVYSYASYAVTDMSAYRTEHEWQVGKLKSLAGCVEK